MGASLSLEDHIRSLQSSPLFNLSLASKELFHSNFLAWLLDRYPAIVGSVFAEFTRTASTSCESLYVHREFRNIDLTIEFPNEERLIVENKVKSLPSLDQLNEYSIQKRHKDRTSFLLLTAR